MTQAARINARANKKLSMLCDMSANKNAAFYNYAEFVKEFFRTNWSVLTLDTRINANYIDLFSSNPVPTIEDTEVRQCPHSMKYIACDEGLFCNRTGRKIAA